MLLANEWTRVWAIALYASGVFLAIVGVLEKLFGWSAWIRRRFAPNRTTGHRDPRDMAVLRAIRETLPRDHVTRFLREHDFGAAWPARWMNPVGELVRQNDVEDRFLDPELEQRRVALHEAVLTLNRLFNTDTWRVQHDLTWQDLGVVPRGPGDPDTVRWERRQRELNDAATQAADAYDALLEAARQRGVL
jgi:hypothetical protein